MNKDTFRQELQKRQLTLDDKQMAQFEQYMRLLQEWNEKMNLTAIVEDEAVWEKHFFDSLIPFTDFQFESLCDVGSGAGFPGIPLAIAYPQRKITLVEPLQKRCRFLREVCDQLGLTNVEIVNARAEDLARTRREDFDMVSARAVARLSILLELCIPLLKTDGTFIAMKGSAGFQELEQAKPALEALHVKLVGSDQDRLEDNSERINLLFKKSKPTPAKYPRAYGQIKKNPLEEVDHG